MSRTKKWFVRITVAVVMLVVLVIAGVIIFIDRIAEAGICAGGTQALGVATKVDNVHIGILTGKASIKGLELAEPAGFKAPHFLTLSQANAAVSLGSLRSDVVDIPLVELSGVDMYIEKNKDGKENYQVIMDRLKTQQNTPPAKNSKKFVIDTISIRDVTVHADVLPVGKPILVKVPDIELRDIGSGGKEMDMSDIMGIVVTSIFASAVANGAGVLPDDVVKGLDQGVKGLASVGSGAVDVAKSAADKVKNAGDDVIKGVGKLFGGK